MFTILLHSSKTMRTAANHMADYQQPILLKQARQLARYVTSMTTQQLASSMTLSTIKSAKTHATWQAWNTTPAHQLPAIDAFLGDIYSGLRASTFTSEERAYANEHLRILSGLYGVLRALDSITVYRLEMGCRLPNKLYSNLYEFWGNRLAKQLPSNNIILNLSAIEYTKAILPHMQNCRIITPKFMTVGRDGHVSFVAVHAKIARGAFARWLIQSRIANTAELRLFNDLNYRYNTDLSTADQPVFVCQTFGGLGLSVRLS